VEVQPKAAKEPPPRKARTGGLANMMQMLRAARDDVTQLYEVTSFIKEFTSIQYVIYSHTS
jgi:hypothetical protein